MHRKEVTPVIYKKTLEDILRVDKEVQPQCS